MVEATEVVVHSTTWKVVPDIRASDVEEKVEKFKNPGHVLDFDFGPGNRTVRDKSSRYSRVDFLTLLRHLWPGCDEEQLEKMNKQREFDNKENEERIRKVRNIRKFTKSELWKFFGMLLCGRLFGGEKGEGMWDNKGVAEGLSVETNQFDPAKWMSRMRFREIKKYIPIMFSSDEAKKKEDPWWQIIQVVDDFNANRKRTIGTSNVRDTDETMSPYCPQTTKNGTIPHLSYVFRKPEPLGTEFKNCLDSNSKIMLCLYLCRNKNDDKGDDTYDNETKMKTARVTLKLMKDSAKDVSDNFGNLTNSDATEPTYLGDSWFSSVDLCVLTKKIHHTDYIGVVKTNHRKYPMKFLGDTMKGWPGGSHLVMETEIDGVTLYALGYKYCKSKVMYFIFTKGAGHTEPGTAYEAKWTDTHGNRCKRYVPRPHVCSIFFGNCNGIDVHNQMRQKILRLEKCWVSMDGYFRILTTIFGICVVDSWRGYMASLNPCHRHCKLKLMDFVDMLAKDMVENTLQDKAELDSSSSFRRTISLADMTSDSTSTVSTLTNTVSPVNNYTVQVAQRDRFVAEHRLAVTDRKVQDEGGSRTRTLRQRCSICKKNKTPNYCEACMATGSKMHYWLCQRCLPAHKVKVGSDYDNEMNLQQEEHG